MNLKLTTRLITTKRQLLQDYMQVNSERRSACGAESKLILGYNPQ